MDPRTVWMQFRDKIAQGALQDSDCRVHAGISYATILSDPKWVNVRRIIAAQEQPAFEYGEDKVLLIDTAGIRRRGRVERHAVCE